MATPWFFQHCQASHCCLDSIWAFSRLRALMCLNKPRKIIGSAKDGIRQVNMKKRYSEPEKKKPWRVCHNISRRQSGRHQPHRQVEDSDLGVSPGSLGVPPESHRRNQGAMDGRIQRACIEGIRLPKCSGQAEPCLDGPNKCLKGQPLQGLILILIILIIIIIIIIIIINVARSHICNCQISSSL